MFTSFDEKVFRKAIQEKDYLCLKVNTVSSMLNDPTFERGETMKVIQILEEQVPEIFEDYVLFDYEERRERSAWDKRYFTKLTYWFQENFSKERIAYIKEVGKAVHQDTAKQYAQSISMQKKPATGNVQPSASRPSQPKTSKPTTSASQNQPISPVAKNTQHNHTGNFPAARAILTVGALVLVGVLLLKLLVK